MEINIFDLAVLVIIVLFALKGILNGFLAEIAGLVGLAVGLLLARTFFLDASALLSGFFTPNVAPAVAFIGLMVIGLLAIALATKLLQRLLKFTFIDWLDHTLGLCVGVVKGILLCALAAYLALLFFPQTETIRSAISLPYLSEIINWLSDAININIPRPW